MPETVFEKPRGISATEVRTGFAQGIVTETELVPVLEALCAAKISIDFVKIIPQGFSFLCPESDIEATRAALSGFNFTLKGNRSLVVTTAVNIRDEEGLLAKLIQSAIHSGIAIEHVADMHDELLLVVQPSHVDELKEALAQVKGNDRVTPRFENLAKGYQLPANTKGIKVMKFGGTSVADAKNRMKAALKVVSAKEQGYLPIVVVSAIGRKGEPYATDTLLGILRDIDPNVAPDAREVDLLAGCGEILSAVIFAHTLKTLGHPSSSFRGGQAGIRTDGVFGNARVIGINPISLFKALEKGIIPVVCGFQGVYAPQDGTPGGELTTLGRGGSDTTASAVGAAVGAKAVEIYTDVEGVKTADPDLVQDAPTLGLVTYDELAEIAHLGAKVVHPRAAEIAMNFGIPLWVKSTFSDAIGTEIVKKGEPTGRQFSGIAHTGKLVHLDFSLGAHPVEHRRDLGVIVLDAMARFNVGLYMVNISEESLSFAVPRDQFQAVREVLDGLVAPIALDTYVFQIDPASAAVRTQKGLLKARDLAIKCEEPCTMVSLVGQDAMSQPGIYLKVMQTLQAENIRLVQTTDSDCSISCLIPESELNRAVLALHKSFGLSEVK